MVLGQEGAQTEEQMPYLGCIWPHVLVVHNLGQARFAGVTVPEAARRLPLVKGFQTFIEVHVHARTNDRMFVMWNCPTRSFS